jgi:hypothetical protein
MMKKKIILLGLMCTILFTAANAQVKLDDILGKVNDLLGSKSILKVKKGFSPKFSLGNLQLNKVGILGEKLKGIKVLEKVLDSKKATQITGLFKTYKTGLVVYKILGGLGAAATTYTTIRGAVGTEKFDAKTVKQLIWPAVGSLLTGVVTKLLTKKASYKAVDIFNGVVKKKVKDIFNIGAASQGAGIGIYVKL